MSLHSKLHPYFEVCPTASSFPPPSSSPTTNLLITNFLHLTQLPDSLHLKRHIPSTQPTFVWPGALSYHHPSLSLGPIPPSPTHLPVTFLCYQHISHTMANRKWWNKKKANQEKAKVSAADPIPAPSQQNINLEPLVKLVDLELPPAEAQIPGPLVSSPITPSPTASQNSRRRRNRGRGQNKSQPETPSTTSESKPSGDSHPGKKLDQKPRTLQQPKAPQKPPPGEQQGSSKRKNGKRNNWHKKDNKSLWKQTVEVTQVEVKIQQPKLPKSLITEIPMADLPEPTNVTNTVGFATSKTNFGPFTYEGGPLLFRKRTKYHPIVGYTVREEHDRVRKKHQEELFDLICRYGLMVHPRGENLPSYPHCNDSKLNVGNPLPPAPNLASTLTKMYRVRTRSGRPSRGIWRKSSRPALWFVS